MIELRGCEQRLIEVIRRDAIPFGRRTMKLEITYQDKLPVFIGLMENVVTLEPLK